MNFEGLVIAAEHQDDFTVVVADLLNGESKWRRSTPTGCSISFANVLCIQKAKMFGIRQKTTTAWRDTELQPLY